MVTLVRINSHLSLFPCTFLKGMDVPDVELVIVNGSMLQFYQVQDVFI